MNANGLATLKSPGRVGRWGGRRFVPMLRQILVVLALVLLVATVAVTVVGGSSRTDGQRALAEVLARHEAGGHGASFHDLAAVAPPVDRGRQARLRDWMKTPGPTSLSWSVDKDLAWRLAGREGPSDRFAEAHAAFRPDAEALAALFAEGELCLTSLGWMPEDPDTATFSDRVGGFIPNLLRVRAAYTYFAFEAVSADDPAPALAMLQLLHEGNSRPGCLIDSMIAVACDSQRDDAMLVLALSGRFPYAWVDAWLDEPPRAGGLMADGLRGERLRFGAPLGQDLARGVSVSSHLGGECDVDSLWDVWDHCVLPWANAASECAVHLEGALALERQLRGDVDRGEASARLADCEGLGYPFSFMMPNASAFAETHVSCEGRHRMVRAAAALALESIRREALPTSEEEALAWLRELRPHLLPAEGDHPLRYAHHARDRFRVGMDFYGDGDALRADEPTQDRPLDLRHDFIEVHLP